MVQYLPCKHKALSSDPSTGKKEKKDQNKPYHVLSWRLWERSDEHTKKLHF
jgi:hypothetical protein